MDFSPPAFRAAYRVRNVLTFEVSALGPFEGEKITPRFIRLDPKQTHFQLAARAQNQGLGVGCRVEWHRPVCSASFRGRLYRTAPRDGTPAGRARWLGGPQVRLRRWGRTVMDNLSIRDLLLLTCMGSFIACATYAVTLLH
jgi:hypothetical protein